MAQAVGTALRARNPTGIETAMADLEEVMRFDPEHGLANLDEHLDRLKDAAEAQGFKFDRHAATFGKRRPAIARLVLSPTGAMAIEVKAEE
jgi:para-aminobenzoate synthetase/4-amino-4-deoxychorismate lyase